MYTVLEVLDDNITTVATNSSGMFHLPEGSFIIEVMDIYGCLFRKEIIISYNDTNNDGITDNEEDVNSNGVLDDDDTDGDGIPDYLDDDDDNDGVDTKGDIDTSGKVVAKINDENFLDTDGDDIPNHRDMDDDGDGIPTIEEDYNGNGDPTDDDIDNSGVADYLEKGVTLSVQDNTLTNKFSLFPNPALSDITVTFNNLKSDFLEISVYTIRGSEMLTKKEINTNSPVTIDISSLATGIYFVSIKNGDDYGVKKLFVK